MKNKKQIVHIHGGMAFNSYKHYLNILKDEMDISFEHPTDQSRWSSNYYRYIESENYQVLRPEMPSKNNAKYIEWKIWFEKLFPYLGDEVILVGHSLGGTFLAKYLSENILPKKIRQLHLVAAVYNHEDDIEQLGDFKMDFPGIFSQNIIGDIFIYHSYDDTLVPISELEKFQSDIPNAKIFRFQDRFHFLDETFPELFENIKNA